MSSRTKNEEYLLEIGSIFRGVKANGFYPISTWFSYGSNLFKQDFERKMTDHGSFLSLVRARPGRLEGWKRSLDNESTTRGLAYSIRQEARSTFVDGILHDVPTADLPAFLQFEGVLDGNYHVKKDPGERRYDIEKVTVRLLSSNDTQNCLTLVGHCPLTKEIDRKRQVRNHKDVLIKYIRTAIKGAIDFGIDIAPFQEDLRWVQAVD